MVSTELLPPLFLHLPIDKQISWILGLVPDHELVCSGEDGIRERPSIRRVVKTGP